VEINALVRSCQADQPLAARFLAGVSGPGGDSGRAGWAWSSREPHRDPGLRAAAARRLED